MGARGSLLGATLLIAGCCIGAGMLGLPVLTAATGYVPSLIGLVAIWGYMVVTGLYLLEVNLSFREEVSLISMADRLLGRAGKVAVWGLFVFLFYSIMVAYLSAAGGLFPVVLAAMLAGMGLDIPDFVVSMPPYIGSVAFALITAAVIQLGTKAVDRTNSLFMVGLIGSYVALVALGLGHVDAELLAHADFKQLPLALSPMVISFGYHNLVPSMTYYLGSDVKRIRLSILLGSGLALLVYVVWETLMLGLIPLHGYDAAKDAGEVAGITLARVADSNIVGQLAQGFSFCAIITSLLGVALSFVDFLADGLGVRKVGARKAGLSLLALLPTLVCGLYFPGIFLTALRVASGFGAVLLFGVLPVVMVYVLRKRGDMDHQRLVPGGMLMMGLVVLISLTVFVVELLVLLGMTGS